MVIVVEVRVIIDCGGMGEQSIVVMMYSSQQRSRQRKYNNNKCRDRD